MQFQLVRIAIKHHQLIFQCESGPLADVLSINAQLGAVYQNGLYSFNCATVNTLPNVTFTFGGKSTFASMRIWIQFWLELSVFIFTRHGIGKPIVLTSSSYLWKSFGYCLSGFIGKQMTQNNAKLDLPRFSFLLFSLKGINGTNQWLLGHSFLSTFYTEFDVAKLRVGFATAKTIA